MRIIKAVAVCSSSGISQLMSTTFELVELPEKSNIPVGPAFRRSQMPQQSQHFSAQKYRNKVS
jgi:hypothetical protein